MRLAADEVPMPSRARSGSRRGQHGPSVVPGLPTSVVDEIIFGSAAGQPCEWSPLLGQLPAKLTLDEVQP